MARPQRHGRTCGRTATGWFTSPAAAPARGGVVSFELRRKRSSISALAPDKFPTVRAQRTRAVFQFEARGDATVVRLIQTGWQAERMGSRLRISRRRQCAAARHAAQAVSCGSDRLERDVRRRERRTNSCQLASDHNYKFRPGYRANMNTIPRGRTLESANSLSAYSSPTPRAEPMQSAAEEVRRNQG